MTAIYQRSIVRVQSYVPTLDTSVYASGDSLSSATMNFLAGNTGFIEKLTVLDKDVQSAAGELWLFSSNLTPAAANAAHSISDADAQLCMGVIPFGAYFASALNSISVAKGLNQAFHTDGGRIYAIAVTRGTPTYTAAGLTFTLHMTIDS